MALTRITKGVIKPNENYDTHNIHSTGIVTATRFDGPFTNLNVSGVTTFTGDANFGGNVSIAGTLTYEDVTNIDSVGIITAQKDIHVGAGVSAVGVGTFGSLDISGDIDVDGHTNLDNVSVAGIATFSNQIKASFGSGSRGIRVGTNCIIQDQGNIMIENTGAGTMYLKGRALQIRDRNNDILSSFSETAGSVLYHHSSSTYKLQTSATGINILEDLDVDGHTNLDNVSIAGVTTMSGNLTISNTAPVIKLVDTDSNSDFSIYGSQGVFNIYDETNTASRLTIASDGTITALQGLVCSSDLTIPDSIIHSGDTNTKIRFPDADTFSVETAGNERLRITSSGNIITNTTGGGIGIRTDNPTTTFHVRGAGVFTSQTGGTITNGLFLDPGDTGAGNRPDIMLKGAGSAALNNLAMQVYYNNGSDKAFHLRYDGGTYHLGNIGIGVENPFTFDTTADDLVISRSYDAGITISVGNAGTTNTASILFAEGTAGTQDKARGAIKYKHGDDYLVFHTNYNEQLRLDANGRLKVGDNVRPASDANEGAQLRVAGAPLTRNQYYSPHGHYFGSIGYTDNSNTKAWLAVDSAYAQSNAVSAGIFLSAFHQDAGGSACGYTIKNLKSTNSLVFSSVKTAASVNNPAVEEERVRINHTGEVGINVTAASGNFLHIKTTTADSFAKIESESGYDAALLLDTSNGSGASADVRFQMDGSTKGSIQYVNNASSADANSMIFRTGNNSAKMQITTDGNIGIPDRTGTDFSLLDGMVINTANGSAGLLINSSSSSHNAYLGFSYGSGSSTSHADQYSAYIGRVGDDNLILGAANDIKVQIGTDGEVKCVGADDNKGFAVYTNATRKVAELIEHSADGELRLYTGESTPVLRSVITSYGDSYLCANSTNKLGIGVGGVHGTIAQKVHIYDASNDPYIRIQRGTTSDINLGGIEFASSNGNGNNMIGTIYGRATGNSATTGIVIVKARDSSSGSSTLHEPLRALGKESSGCRLMSQGNAVCVFGRHHETGGTDATADAPTYNVVYEHSSSSYRTSGNGAFGGTFVVGGNASTWYPVWFSLPTHQDPQILSVHKYVHNYATWDGKLLFRASLLGTGYGAFQVQHRIHFFGYSYKQFVGKAIYTGHNNAYLVLWMLGGGRSYQWGTIGARGITVNVGDDGNTHNLGPGNTAEGPITSAVTIPVGYEQAMTTSGTHQQSDGF